MANAAARDDDDHLIAHDVDVEPVEPNRRVLAGWRNALIVVLAVAYPAFHMAALNGLSIRDLTGIDLPFLPRLPMETWNFRIVHVAGALILGFLLFAAVRFRDGDSDAGQGPAGTARLAAAWVALAAAALALGMAVLFARQIAGGVMWNGIDETIRFRETWLFGVPLVAASLAGIVLSWVWPRARGRFALPDIVLCVAAAAVAAYLITIYGTLMRNSTGTPFAPIGISLAAVAGTLLIMELTRRMAGMALVIIAAVFLIYVFAGRFMPGFLKAPAIDLGTLLQPGLHRCGHPRADHGRQFDLYHPVHHLRRLPAGLEGRRLFRQLRLCRGGPGARRPGQGGDLCQRPDGDDQRHLGGQCGGHRLADDPADEEGRLSQADRRRGRGRGQHGRPDHAADHGRGRLHHGRDHRHPLYRDRARCDHPGGALLRVGLFHGRFRSCKARHARHEIGRAAEILPDGAPGRSCSCRSSS
jgi:hypothetical protein